MVCGGFAQLSGVRRRPGGASPRPVVGSIAPAARVQPASGLGHVLERQVLPFGRPPPAEGVEPEEPLRRVARQPVDVPALPVGTDPLVVAQRGLALGAPEAVPGRSLRALVREQLGEHDESEVGAARPTPARGRRLIGGSVGLMNRYTIRRGGRRGGPGSPFSVIEGSSSESGNPSSAGQPPGVYLLLYTPERPPRKVDRRSV